jgi:hypothetical protein
MQQGEVKNEDFRTSVVCVVWCAASVSTVQLLAYLTLFQNKSFVIKQSRVGVVGTPASFSDVDPEAGYPDRSFMVCLSPSRQSTERRGRVVNTPASYFGGLGLKSSSRDRISWLRFLVIFLGPPRRMTG